MDRFLTWFRFLGGRAACDQSYASAVRWSSILAQEFTAPSGCMSLSLPVGQLCISVATLFFVALKDPQVCPSIPSCPTCPSCPGAAATTATSATPATIVTGGSFGWTSFTVVFGLVVSPIGYRLVRGWGHSQFDDVEPAAEPEVDRGFVSRRVALASAVPLRLSIAGRPRRGGVVGWSSGSE